MGILDGLKKMFEPGKPPFTVEPQCLRHVFFTVRLPAGWQFTSNDGRQFFAAGPGGSSAVFFVSPINQPFSKIRHDDLRPMIARLVRGHVLAKRTVEEKELPNGVFWFEASDAPGELRVLMFNPQPRDPQIHTPPGLDVTCKASGAGPLETVRAALRSVEWN